jgi:hypothetical protein
MVLNKDELSLPAGPYASQPRRSQAYKIGVHLASYQYVRLLSAKIADKGPERARRLIDTEVVNAYFGRKP